MFLLFAVEIARKMTQAGSSASCHEPQNGAKAVPCSPGPVFSWMGGWNGNRGHRNATTAKHKGGDRPGPWHMKIRRDQKNVVDVVLLQVRDERREIGDRIDSAIVEMQAIAGDSRSFKDGVGSVRWLSR